MLEEACGAPLALPPPLPRHSVEPVCTFKWVPDPALEGAEEPLSTYRGACLAALIYPGATGIRKFISGLPSQELPRGQKQPADS